MDRPLALQVLDALDDQKFREWLANPELETVGIGGDAYSCPVQHYLAAVLGDSPVVYGHALTVGHVRYLAPPWLEVFVLIIDRRWGDERITPEQALEALGQAQALLDISALGDRPLQTVVAAWLNTHYPKADEE